MASETIREELPWETAEVEQFWGEIAQGQHVLQVYHNEEDFINTLFTFADAGFRAGESVIVIATTEHTRRLDMKLREAGHNLFNLRLRDQYMAVNASHMLAEFMFKGDPDPILFKIKVSDVIKRARRHTQRVRVFGEMVDLLWLAGNKENALRLEHMWNEFLAEEPITLFCAHNAPDTADANDLFTKVRHAHERCLCGDHQHDKQVLFRSA